MTMFRNTPKPEQSEKVVVSEKPVEKKKAKRKALFGWKFKLALWSFVLIAIVSGIVEITILVGGWFDANKIVPHQVIELKISPPFTIESRMVSPISGESAEPKVASPSGMRVIPQVMAQEPNVIDQLTDYIHLAESTRGKALVGLNATCKAKGMSNEYGYRAGEGFCFPTEEEATATVKDWVHRSLQVRGVPETLCRYNTGNPVDDCPYADQFFSLLESGKI